MSRRTALVYALGGGHGHGVRGLAVLHALRTRCPAASLDAHLIASERLRPWVVSESVGLHVPPPRARSRELLGWWVRDLLDGLQPDLILVDVFPRGVLAELPELAAPAWLMSRHVPRSFYLAPEVRAAIESRFRELLWCEQPPVWALQLDVDQREVAPVLIRSPAACSSREAARSALGIAPERKAVIVLATGEATRQLELVRLMARMRLMLRAHLGEAPEVVVLSADLEPFAAAGVRVTAHIPAMEVLRSADVVVSAGGYQSVWEARALQIPVVCLPQSRPLDDQLRRSQTGAVATSPGALLEALVAGLTGCLGVSPAVSGDGAAEIAELVLGG
jgi:hypothetical protein